MTSPIFFFTARRSTRRWWERWESSWRVPCCRAFGKSPTFFAGENPKLEDFSIASLFFWPRRLLLDSPWLRVCYFSSSHLGRDQNHSKAVAFPTWTQGCKSTNTSSVGTGFWGELTPSNSFHSNKWWPHSWNITVRQGPIFCNPLAIWQGIIPHVLYNIHLKRSFPYCQVGLFDRGRSKRHYFPWNISPNIIQTFIEEIIQNHSKGSNHCNPKISQVYH